MKLPLKIGCRVSPLARVQAEIAQQHLMKILNITREACKIITFTTKGDRIIDQPLHAIGNKGVFTKEIEYALLDKRIDIAVHSLKDMSTLMTQGLIIGGYLPREDPRDGFISNNYYNIDCLPTGAVIGTSSVRRRAQIYARYPHLNTVEFRGNVHTRLKKLNDNVADATFLAMAGLNRLKLSHLARPISTTDMLPAIAQGCIAIQCRADDAAVKQFLFLVNHNKTALCMQAERTLLAGLNGSCQTPIAGLATLKDNKLYIMAEILPSNGSATIRHIMNGHRKDAKKIGYQMATYLRNRAPDNFFN